MSRRVPSSLSDAQFEIMSVVWDHGKCTVADVLQELRQRRPVTRNTVHTMMTRLVERGWLSVDDEKVPFVYQAAVLRETARQDRVEKMIDTVFDGSAEGLLLSLLQNRRLTAEEATRIRRLIKQSEQKR